MAGGMRFVRLQRATIASLWVMVAGLPGSLGSCPAIHTMANGVGLSRDPALEPRICSLANLARGECTCPGDVTIQLSEVYEDWSTDGGRIDDVRVKYKDLGLVRGNLRLLGGVFNQSMSTPVPEYIETLNIIMQNLEEVAGDLIIENADRTRGYALAASFPSLHTIGGNLVFRTSEGTSTLESPGDPIHCSASVGFSQDFYRERDLPPGSTLSLRTLHIGGDVIVDVGCGTIENINFRGVNVSGSVQLAVSNNADVEAIRFGYTYPGNVQSQSNQDGFSLTANSYISGNFTVMLSSLGSILNAIDLSSDTNFKVEGAFTVINTGGRLAGITASPALTLGQTSAGITLEESGVPNSEAVNRLTDPITGVVLPLTFDFGALSKDGAGINTEMITSKVDHRSLEYGAVFDDMTLTYGTSAITNVANGRIVQCFGYLKLNENGLSPGGSNCLATRPPTHAPTRMPTGSPTKEPTPASLSPSMAPTTIRSTQSLDTEASSDSTVVIIVVVLVLVALLGGLAYWAYYHWKKTEAERQNSDLVGDSFMVNPAFKSSTLATQRMSATLSSTPAKSATPQQESYLVPAASKKKKAKPEKPNANTTNAQHTGLPEYDLGSNTKYVEQKENAKSKKPKAKNTRVQHTALPEYDLGSNTKYVDEVQPNPKSAGSSKTKKQSASSSTSGPDTSKKANGASTSLPTYDLGSFRNGNQAPKKKKKKKTEANTLPTYDMASFRGNDGRQEKRVSKAAVQEPEYDLGSFHGKKKKAKKLDKGMNPTFNNEEVENVHDGGYLDMDTDPNMVDGVYDAKTYNYDGEEDEKFGF